MLLFIRKVITMLINTDNMVSTTEANQNFSRVTRMVDQNGIAIVMKNNLPKYVVVPFESVKRKEKNVPNEKIREIANRLVMENSEALEALAK